MICIVSSVVRLGLVRLSITALALWLLSGCVTSTEETAEEEPGAEETTEETTVEETTATATVEETTEEIVTNTEIASVATDELASCEAELYATKGPNATLRWEAAGIEERQRMCAQLRGEPVPPPPSKAQKEPPDWRTPSQKVGTNEAGQDVSNTPVISPEERASRGACLSSYYQSLPPEQRGPESQRVTAEANAQGVTPYDIVRC